MTTFLEHLQQSVGASYSLRDIIDNLTDEQIVDEVNNFAQKAANEALNNAAEKFNTNTRCDAETRYHILLENNIPKL